MSVPDEDWKKSVRKSKALTLGLLYVATDFCFFELALLSSGFRSKGVETTG